MEAERRLLVGIEYPLDRNILIVNINKLKADSYVDVNVSENMIRIAAMAVQDMVIEKVVGSHLFDKLRRLICDGELEQQENWPYKDLLENYLFPIFSYGIQAEISIPLSYRNRNNGTVRATTDSTTQPQLSEIKYLNQYYLNKMDHYVSRAIRYLSCNCYFPELKECECAWASERPLSKKPSTTLNLSMRTAKRARFPR